MARIAFVQNKLKKTDGVSLEIDKWRTVLEKMGHDVFYIAGNDDAPGIHVIPELSLFHPEINRILRNGTVELSEYDSEEELLADIHRMVPVIKTQLLKVIRELKIELLLPNNLLSVGYNLPAMVAIHEVLEETGLPAIVHSHDFWWEDSGETQPTCDGVKQIYERSGPPDLPNAKHVVINAIAHDDLLERRGIASTIVPNVFDFSQPAWEPDDFNQDFRQQIGLSDGDIMLLQATRVLDRKGIELGIDLVAELSIPSNREHLAASQLYDGRRFTPDGRIVLVCSGYVEQFGITGDYVDRLKARAQRKGVEILFVGDRVRHTRSGASGDADKIYSLWDSYVSADLVTYTSWWEGWGNQFVEAVFARKPVYVFEYPVFATDLKPARFDLISLGSELAAPDTSGLVTVAPDKVRAAARGAVEMLTDADRRKRAVDHNFRVARENFGYDKLTGLVQTLMDEALSR